MKSLLRLLLKTQQKQNQSAVSGFTMIELLVGVVMAFLILTPLFAFVLDVLNSDKKEQAKASTEQEIQAAVDYITQDLQQAVFIYDQTGINTITQSQPTALPTQNATNIPVLVFWKRELVSQVLPVFNNTPPVPLSNCSTAPNTCDDSYVYSLVAYYLEQRNPGNTWSNQARIVRYSIRDCVKDPTSQASQCLTSNSAVTGWTQNNYQSKARGDATPATAPSFPLFNLKLSGANLAAKMNRWPRFINATGQEVIQSYTFPTGAGNQSVLVDYIDVSANTTTCSATEERVPPIAANTPGGFFACVISTPTPPPPAPGQPANTIPPNSVARVFIRGNSLARLGQNSTVNANNQPFFPTVSVQVQARGVITPQ